LQGVVEVGRRVLVGAGVVVFATVMQVNQPAAAAVANPF